MLYYKNKSKKNPTSANGHGTISIFSIHHVHNYSKVKHLPIQPQALIHNIHLCIRQQLIINPSTVWGNVKSWNAISDLIDV